MDSRDITEVPSVRLMLSGLYNKIGRAACSLTERKPWSCLAHRHLQERL